MAAPDDDTRSSPKNRPRGRPRFANRRRRWLCLLTTATTCRFGVLPFLLWLGPSSTAHALSSTTLHRYWASCAKGLEDCLAHELKSPKVQAQGVTLTSRGVEFEGDAAVGYRAVVESRLATRVNQELGRWDGVRTRDDIYALGRDIKWRDLMTVDQTLSVETKIGEDVKRDIAHSHFTSLTLKNAVADAFRERLGARPSINLDDPDVPLILYLHRDQAKLYRSLSSGSLHKRGYREKMHAASLRETVAAGCLSLAGVLDDDDDDDDDPLCRPKYDVVVDPMCGSGTLAIEAALAARDVAPGLLRAGEFGRCGEKRRQKKPLAATRWLDADLVAWRRSLEAAAHRVRRDDTPPRFRVVANDANGAALTLARRDAFAAGVENDVDFSDAPVDAGAWDIPLLMRPPETNGCDRRRRRLAVVSNPPWGARLKDGPASWAAMGAFLRRHPGAEAHLLCGHAPFSRELKLRVERRTSLATGGVALKLLKYRVFDDDDHDDERRRRRREPADPGAHDKNPRRRAVEHVAAGGPPVADNLDGLTVVALKARLRHQGLKVSGRKQELIDRLRQHPGGGDGAAPSSEGVLVSQNLIASSSSSSSSSDVPAAL